MNRLLPILLLMMVGLPGCERRTPQELVTEAETALAAGREAEAVELLQKAVRKNPSHRDAHYRLGRIYHDRENFPMAVTHLEKAVAADPEEPKLLYRFGDVLLDADEDERAIEILERARKADPGSGGVYAKLAQAYRREGQEARAKETLRAGLVTVAKDDPFYAQLQAEYQ